MLRFPNVVVIAFAASFLRAGGEATGQRHSEPNTGEYVGYRAAALQYHSFDDISGGGFAALEVNAMKYIKYIEEASTQGAQIIVFPEHGLTGLTLASTIDEYLPQTQVVPDPEDHEVPCDYTDVLESSQIMKQLSCAARENHIYLVVCLAEQFNCSQTIDASAIPSGCEFYDTQAVFDDKGAIIARYRKKHLFVEDHFMEGTDPDTSAVFETSFGVTFTLMISFDLLYYDPAVSNMENLGIRDVITSSGWMDQLPFLVAPQIWKGFSEGYQANLIAANHYNPMEGFLGAGIFRGVAGDPEIYTYDTSSGTKLVIGDVLTQPQNSTRSKGSNYGLGHKTVSHSFGPLKGIKHSAMQEPRIKHSAMQEPQVKHPAMQEPRIKHSAMQKPQIKHSAMQKPQIKHSAMHDPQAVTTGESRNRHEKKTEFTMFQKYKHENLENYTFIILNQSDSNEPIRRTLYHKDIFACSVLYSYPTGGSADYLYMLISHTGLTEHANYTYFVYNENCAVVLCLNENISSCGHIEGATLGDSTFKPVSLQGLFNDHYIYPSILTDSMQLFDSTKWSYTIVKENDEYQATISIDEEINDILTLGLYSRVFSRDP